MDIAHLVVQILILAGLIWYACETWKIRKTSQQQVETSQRQIGISQEQNETMQKPCLVLSVRKRKDMDTATDALSGNPYPEQKVPDGQQSGTGHVELHNIGAGPAFNIKYEVLTQGKPKKFMSGSLPHISNGKKAPVFLIEDSFSSSDQHEEVELRVLYESLSGIRYESALHIRESRSGPVVTCYEFRSCSPQ